MPKIYILGSVGSGKSTLARKISAELNIPCYELDNIVWQKNETGPDSKRDELEINQMFQNILIQDNWIIENVGRSYFNEGLKESDAIIYLDLNRGTLYYRVFKRWLKQNIGLENAPYKTDLKMLKQMLKWVDKEKNNSKLKKLNEYADKTIILNNKNINKYQEQDRYQKLILKK